MDPADRTWLPGFYDALAPTYALELEEAAGYLAAVRAFLDANAGPPARVLDVGCGPGNFTAGLPAGVHVAGLDLSPGMIAHARQARPAGDWRVGDYHDAFPRNLGSFDVVVMAGAFEFCTDLPGVLGNLAAATRTGGAVLACVTELVPGSSARRHRAPAPTPDGFIELRLFGRDETEAAARAARLVPRGAPPSVPGWKDRNGVQISYAMWELTRGA